MYSHLYRIFNVTDEFFYLRGFIILFAVFVLYRAVKDPNSKKLKRVRGLALILIVSSIFDLFMFQRRELLKWAIELPTIILGTLLYLKASRMGPSQKFTPIRFHLSSFATGSFLTLGVLWFFLFPMFGGHLHIHKPFLKQAIEPTEASVLLESEKCSCQMGDNGWFLFKGSVGDGVLFVYNRGFLEKLNLTGNINGDDSRTYITYANEYLSLPFSCAVTFEKTDGNCDAKLPEDNCNLEKVFTCDLVIKDLKSGGKSKPYSGLKSKCKCQ